jgi:hypothetical protein
MLRFIGGVAFDVTGCRLQGVVLWITRHSSVKKVFRLRRAFATPSPDIIAASSRRLPAMVSMRDKSRVKPATCHGQAVGYLQW